MSSRWGCFGRRERRIYINVGSAFLSPVVVFVVTIGYDRLDQAPAVCDLTRRPDDFEFRRVLLLLLKADASLSVEKAVEEWQSRLALAV